MVCVIYYSQGPFLILTQGHLNIKVKIMVFSEITGPMKVKSLCGGIGFFLNHFHVLIKQKCFFSWFT